MIKANDIAFEFWTYHTFHQNVSRNFCSHKHDEYIFSHKRKVILLFAMLNPAI